MNTIAHSPTPTTIMQNSNCATIYPSIGILGRRFAGGISLQCISGRAERRRRDLAEMKGRRLICGDFVSYEAVEGRMVIR